MANPRASCRPRSGRNPLDELVAAACELLMVKIGTYQFEMPDWLKDVLVELLYVLGQRALAVNQTPTDLWPDRSNWLRGAPAYTQKNVNHLEGRADAWVTWV